jgi:glutamyl endopeptidase
MTTTQHTDSIRDLFVRERDEEQANANAAGTSSLQLEGHTSVGSDGAESSGPSSEGSAETGGTGHDLEVEATATVDLTAAAEVDESLALDAYWATYGDASTRAALRASGDDIAEVVIGADDRTRISPASAYPWRAIASLAITAGNGTSWIGTAWFISPRLLMTAGHCVFMPDQGGWARQIVVMPGRDGAQQPYGRAVSASFRSVTGWTTNRHRSFDYGAILLGPQQRLGDTVGWFGWQVRDDAGLNGQTVNISGYPGDKPAGTQWFHANKVTAVTPTTFTYQVDTAGGQSGAPVWMLLNGQRIAVGIHTNGALSGNSATRINGNVATNINAWRSQVP